MSLEHNWATCRRDTCRRGMACKYSPCAMSSLEDLLRDAYFSGSVARALSKTETTNPFSSGSPEHERWQAGWISAGDLDEDPT